MFTRTRNKAVLTLGFVLLVLVVNCSSPQEVKTPTPDTELAVGTERTSSIAKVPSTQEPTSQSKGQTGGTEPPPAATDIPAAQTQQSPTLTPETKTGAPSPDAQTSDTKPVAKKETKPSAEKKPSKQEPTTQSIAQPGATDPAPETKELPGTQTQQSSSLTPEIKISEVGSDLPDYDRGDWKHWIDDDRDCQNARHEVLIEESLIEVAFKSPKQCQVATGKWLDPYTGDTITDATKLDVDHMVPLKNAHDSGGWAWDKDKKAAYANEMVYADHLIAVTASANRKKGARGPEGWKPTNEGYWCDYAIDWVQIKFDWGLSATEAEWAALQEMLLTCDNQPSYTPVPSKPQLAATPVASATTPATDSADIQIASIDCKSKPEILVIKNNGRSPQNLTGWKVQDDGPEYTFDFPKGFSLQPKSLVDLISGTFGDNTATTIYWSGRTVWNNDGDTARLFDSTGELVSEMKCPSTDTPTPPATTNQTSTPTPTPTVTATPTPALPVVTLNDINLKNAAIRLMDFPAGAILVEEVLEDSSSSVDTSQRVLDWGWQGSYSATYGFGGMVGIPVVALYETKEGAHRSVTERGAYLTEKPPSPPWEMSWRKVEVTGLGNPSAAFVEVYEHPDGEFITAENTLVSVYFVRGNILGKLTMWAGIGFPVPTVEYVAELALKHEARIVKELLSASTPGSPPASTVSFGDENLERLIRQLLGKTKSQSITVEDLADITSITVWLAGSDIGTISDLSGIENCVNLTSLNLLFQDVTDLSPLASLINLTELDLGYNPIEDIMPLASLTNLTKLNLSFHTVTDLSPLASLINLTELHLGSSLLLTNSRITDLTPLESLTNLTVLDLDSTGVTDITPLASLINLTELDLSFNGVTDITPLASLINLTELDLSRNYLLEDITPLNPLINLIELNLSSTKVKDIQALRDRGVDVIRD